MRRYIGYPDFYSTVIASPFLLSLRAERGNLKGILDCFVVRQLTDLLAMTERGAIASVAN
jgi:hypothetical protein